MTSHAVQQGQSKKVKTSLILCLLFVVFLSPIFFAKTMYKRADLHTFKHTNVGDLILPPKSLSDLTFKTLETSALKEKWALMYVAPKTYNEDCQENLYNMRQIHTSLGKESERFARVLSLTAESDFSHSQTEITETYPKLINMTFADNSYIATLGAIGDKAKQEEFGEYFLIDPNGNIMMHYAGDTAPKGMLKDIKRLMRASQIG